MARGKLQPIVECPECLHKFDRYKDVVNKLCTRCNQWRAILDFNAAETNVCKICLGINVSRFSTQMRIRTKAGELLKQCTKCKLWRHEESYSADKNSRDGLQCECKDCNTKFRTAKRAREQALKGKRECL